ncbi:MAG: protein-disulfide reductase DsbD domain-containing protein, partial [Pseudomonadota bacterium]
MGSLDAEHGMVRRKLNRGDRGATSWERLARSAVWLVAFLIAAILTAMPPANAEDAPVPLGEVVAVDLVTDKTTVRPGSTLRVALRQQIPEGWHTYWHNPGDSGAPTRLTWTLPEGVSAGPLQFPAPERIAFGPLMNYGFHGTVYLVTEIAIGPDVPVGATLTLSAFAEWLACEEICIPEEKTVDLAVAISSGPELPSLQAGEIDAAVEAYPQAASWPARYNLHESGAERAEFRLYVEEPSLAEAAREGLFARATFFPFKGGLVENSAPIRLASGERGLGYAIEAGADAQQFDGPVEGVLVLDETASGEPVRRAYRLMADPIPEDLEGAGFGVFPASASDRVGASGVATLTLPVAVVFAFLAGVLLNLMPCVFPVLFVKAMGFVSSAQGGSKELRRGGLAYTAGVLASFLALATFMIALRAGGAEIGWGFQLQSPLIVLLLSYLMLGLALNLSGVWSLPARFAGAGQGLTERGGTGGSFFTGVLAVIVASPCTAPFMGAALAFGLAQSGLSALFVFAALGLGMAAPFLVLSFVPGLSRRLPKPGAWMRDVKEVLAFPLYGAAAWLVWVFSAQVDRYGHSAGLAGLLLVGFAFWLFGRSQTGGVGRGQTVRASVAAVALFAAVGLALAPTPEAGQGGQVQRAAAPTEADRAGLGLAAEPYSAQTLAAL